MGKILSNPLFIYIFSFGLIVLVYLLGWSNLFPALSLKLLGFLLVTFVIAFLVGVFLNQSGRIRYHPISSSATKTQMILLWIGWAMEFAYNGGIPLLQLMKGEGTASDYQAFGIPTFHVFLVTINGFYSVYLFHQMISGYTRRKLFFFLLSILPSMLISSRGGLLMVLGSCLFVYLLSLKTVSPKVVTFLTILILGILFVFGIFGNLRITSGTTTSSEYMLKISEATPEFTESVIPKPYIWTYMYVSSPMANLQNTVILSNPYQRSAKSFFIHELFPDFIAKRIGARLGIERSDVPRIANWLTVSTFYARPYAFMGWAGMWIMFSLMCLVNVFYLFFIPTKSRYYVTGLAILNSIVLFNTFDNMYSVTGLVFQLFYPLFFSIVFRRSSEPDGTATAPVTPVEVSV